MLMVIALVLCLTLHSKTKDISQSSFALAGDGVERNCAASSLFLANQSAGIRPFVRRTTKFVSSNKPRLRSVQFPAAQRELHEFDDVVHTGPSAIMFHMFHMGPLEMQHREVLNSGSHSPVDLNSMQMSRGRSSTSSSETADAVWIVDVDQ